MLALRSIERPIAGGDASVVAQDNGTRKHVQGVLLDPLVPIALIKLVAVCRMPEKTRAVTHFRTDGVVEVPEASGAELVPVTALELIEDSGLFRAGPCNGSDRAGSEFRFRAFEPAEFPTSAAVLAWARCKSR